VGSSAGSILAGPSVEPFVMEEMLELPKDFVLQSTKTIELVDYIVLPHHAGREEAHADMQEKFSSTYQFVTLEDDEYRIESFK
jgi:peptidase E